MSDTNFLTLKFNLQKNKNTKSAAYGKYYAKVANEKTLTTAGLAQHMIDHGCLIGKDAIVAVLVKFSECIPEIVGQGYGVMLDGLGKFYPTILSEGADPEQMADEGWQPQSIVKGVRLRFLPTSTALQNLTSKQYKDKISLEAANVVELKTKVVDDENVKYYDVQKVSDFLFDLRHPQEP